MYGRRACSRSRRRDFSPLRDETRRCRSRSPLLRSNVNPAKRKFRGSRCLSGLMDIMSAEVRVQISPTDHHRRLNRTERADASGSSCRIATVTSQPSLSDSKYDTATCIDYGRDRMGRPGDYRKRSIAERLGHAATSQPFEATGETESTTASPRGPGTSTTLAMESLQATAAEIMSLEHTARMGQIKIYKESRDYQIYDEHFPKHNKRYERPKTPDQAGIPPSEWMAKFSRWKNEIAEILDKKKIKSRVIENDEETLMRRQKNIDYCKGTEAYHQYLTLIPRSQRQRRDPRTPDKFAIYSRRAWDGCIKSWKLRIHRRLEEFPNSQS